MNDAVQLAREVARAEKQAATCRDRAYVAAIGSVRRTYLALAKMFDDMAQERHNKLIEALEQEAT